MHEAPPGQTYLEMDFGARLRQLREGWRERREVARLVQAGDAPSQLELLQRIHAWASNCAAMIASVYGPEMPASVSPCPRTLDDVSVVVTVAQVHRLVFSVVPRSGGGWRVSARSLSGTGTAIAAAATVGPSRRDGSWTRARVEDLILAQVAAVERSRAEAPPNGR
jgi:hypothetical protein